MKPELFLGNKGISGSQYLGQGMDTLLSLLKEYEKILLNRDIEEGYRPKYPTLEYVVLTEQYDDLEKKYSELLEKNKVPEGCMRVDVPVGALIISPIDLPNTSKFELSVVMEDGSIVNPPEEKSAHYKLYSYLEVESLLAEQHRNTVDDIYTRLFAAEYVWDPIRAIDSIRETVRNKVLTVKQRSPLQ